MDLVSFGFLVVMVLAGGLVALIADKLGRTLGKKRLTLFGLRPRHTATMITVFAGMLIPFLTVIFVAIVSKDAREWLVEGRQALDKLNERNAEITRLNDKEKDLTLQVKNTTLTLEQKERLLKQETQHVATLQSETTKLQVQAASLNATVHNLTSNVHLLTANLNRTKLSLTAAQRDTRAAISAKQKAQGDLLAAQKRLTQVQQSYYELKAQWDELNQQNEKLASDNDKLTSENASLADQNAKAANDLSASKASLEKSREELDNVNVLLSQVNKQYGVLLGGFKSDLKTSRFQHIIFNIGDELARVSIPANASPAQAKGLLANLMQEANRNAQVHGAGPLSDTNTEFAGFVRRPDADGRWLDPREQEDAVLKGITGNKDDLVLVATAIGNTFNGEGVPLDIKPWKNPLVYKRNDQVAEVRINGSLPEEDIRQQVVDFITNFVKPKALTDNMIPVAGQAEQFGDIPINEIVELARNIHETNRPVKVAALASFDTRAADPLKLHFRVR